jgi:hypothetical protein
MSPVAGGPLEFRDGRYVFARPLGFYGIARRFRLAWLVFTGKADVLVWEAAPAGGAQEEEA